MTKSIGLGGMIAFTPFAGSPDDAKKTVLALYDAGVISFICGSNPSRVRFLMPIGAVTDEDIDEVLKILEATLTKLSA